MGQETGASQIVTIAMFALAILLPSARPVVGQHLDLHPSDSTDVKEPAESESETLTLTDTAEAHAASDSFVGDMDPDDIEPHEVTDMESDYPLLVEPGSEVILETPIGELEEVVPCETCEPEPAKSEEQTLQFGDWLGYNTTMSDTTWLAGSDFGMFSLESFPTLEFDKNSALMVGTGFHFLDGPVRPHVRPRLFDFQMAYQARKAVSSSLILDLRIGVGAFSDFERSARKGVRFPGHVVTYYDWSPRCVAVFGVDVLDRDDISVLPVAGIVWRPKDDLVYEFIFPRPKVQVRLDNDKAMYFSGEIGGGTWAIKRGDKSSDNMTYRDIRLMFGIKQFGNSVNSVLEIGWATDRHMEFRSTRGDQRFDDALILRSHTHF